MATLSPGERKALKARAHHLHPVVMIGEAGLTPAVLHEIGVALRSHELIKIRVLGQGRERRAWMAERICRELGASLVQQIGKILVIFRPRPANPAPQRYAGRRRKGDRFRPERGSRRR